VVVMDGLPEVLIVDVSMCIKKLGNQRCCAPGSRAINGAVHQEAGQPAAAVLFHRKQGNQLQPCCVSGSRAISCSDAVHQEAGQSAISVMLCIRKQGNQLQQCCASGSRAISCSGAVHQEAGQSAAAVLCVRK
jgi:hypothetical protein